MTTDQFIQALNVKPTHSTEWIKKCLASLELNPKTSTVSPEIQQENEATYQRLRVETLKKYDIVKVQTMCTVHYILVHRVKNETVYGLVITSKEACWTIMQIENDRRFKGSFITNSYMCFPFKDCQTKFIAVYEDKREANKAFKIVL